MGGFTDAREQAVLDSEFGSGAPATLFLALFTTMPADDGTGGVEVSGGAYARVSVTNNATNFPAATAGNPSTKNLANGPWAFPAATTSWGNVKGIGWYDASSAGNLRWAQELLDSVQVVTDANASTDVLTTAGSHGFVAGDRVAFRDVDGSVPAGLDQTSVFFVIATGLTATQFKVSLTLGGAAVDITAAGETTTKVYKTYAQDVVSGNTVSFATNAIKMQLD